MPGFNPTLLPIDPRQLRPITVVRVLPTAMDDEAAEIELVSEGDDFT